MSDKKNVLRFFKKKMQAPNTTREEEEEFIRRIMERKLSDSSLGSLKDEVEAFYNPQCKHTALEEADFIRKLLERPLSDNDSEDSIKDEIPKQYVSLVDGDLPTKEEEEEALQSILAKTTLIKFDVVVRVGTLPFEERKEAKLARRGRMWRAGPVADELWDGVDFREVEMTSDEFRKFTASKRTSLRKTFHGVMNAASAVGERFGKLRNIDVRKKLVKDFEDDIRERVMSESLHFSHVHNIEGDHLPTLAMEDDEGEDAATSSSRDRTEAAVENEMEKKFVRPLVFTTTSLKD